MLQSLFTNPKSFLMGLLLSVPGLIIALSFHEFAHGYAAYKMGDNTAKYSGRLSLNPLDHLDTMGTICLFLCGFGWAKPVPINPYNFKNHRLGVVIVSLAGPLMNFVIALVSAFIYFGIVTFAPINMFVTFIANIMYFCMYLNIGLMCFNLIPIPPLDGSKVLLEFLPYRYRQTFYRLERHASFILMILLITDVLNPVLGTMRNFVETIIYFIVGLIF